MAEIKFNTDIQLLNNARVMGALPAIAAGQYVTFEQLQAAIEGLSPKDNARVFTSSNINLASPGASLDGVAMVANDRFVAGGQTLPAENGIYIWNGTAVAATRAPDGNTGPELVNAIIAIDEGTNGQRVYRQTSVNITLGTTGVAWVAFGNVAPAASETVQGIAELATQAETDAGTDDLRIVTPLKLKTWSGAPRKYSVLFGDGTATQYDLTHNLNTRNVGAIVFIESSGETIECQITRTSVNVVRINTNTAPASNAYRLVVGD